MGDDEPVEACRGNSVSKLGMASREGVARSEAHKKILDRLFLAVRVNGVEKLFELG